MLIKFFVPLSDLQSKLTRTRVIHINENQSGLASSVEEASNISLGDKQIIDVEAEHGVSNTDFESYTENLTPRYLISPTNDYESDEVNLASDFDIEIIEDVQLPKRSEGTISTNVLASVSKVNKDIFHFFPLIIKSNFKNFYFITY